MPETYGFTNKETGKFELVNPVRWRWIAHYEDNSKLYQYDDETKLFHQLKEIDRSKLAYFEMVCPDYNYGFKLAIPKEGELVHFYRNIRPAGESRWYRYFIFGWKVEYQGQIFKRLIQIFPDDSIRLLDDDGRP